MCVHHLSSSSYGGGILNVGNEHNMHPSASYRKPPGAVSSLYSSLLVLKSDKYVGSNGRRIFQKERVAELFHLLNIAAYCVEGHTGVYNRVHWRIT